MDLGLQGRVAMVTGGSHGLGRQAAAALGREGCKVAICARGTEQLEETRADLDGSGIEVIAVQADVTDHDDLLRFHNETKTALGEVDILVNNVGGRRGEVDFVATGMERFREGLEVNLLSAVELVYLVLPHMREQKWGRIISISSIYGREYGGSVDYMTGKAALIAFSKHLALNLAPRMYWSTPWHPAPSISQAAPGTAFNRTTRRRSSTSSSPATCPPASSAGPNLSARRWHSWHPTGPT